MQGEISNQRDWRADVLEREELRIKLVSWHRALQERWRREDTQRVGQAFAGYDALLWPPRSQLGGKCTKAHELQRRRPAGRTGCGEPWRLGGAALAVIRAPQLAAG